MTMTKIERIRTLIDQLDKSKFKTMTKRQLLGKLLITPEWQPHSMSFTQATQNCSYAVQMMAAVFNLNNHLITDEAIEEVIGTRKLSVPVLASWNKDHIYEEAIGCCYEGLMTNSMLGGATKAFISILSDWVDLGGAFSLDQ